LTDAPF